jgi:hypothetical protein
MMRNAIVLLALALPTAIQAAEWQRRYRSATLLFRRTGRGRHHKGSGSHPPASASAKPQQQRPEVSRIWWPGLSFKDGVNFDTRSNEAD